MTIEAISSREPLVDVVREGDRTVGYVSNAWFRYLVAAGAPIDLTSGVTGELPVENGGTGTAPTTFSVTGAATTIAPDGALFFVVQDTTSGGMAVGVMDRNGVVIPVVFFGIGGVIFARLAGTGLQAHVTAGANPRVLNVFAISIGTP